MARHGAARLPLALLLLLQAACRVSARSAAARASASGAGGGGANSGIVTLVSTAVAGPLPPALQASADAIFASAGATLAGTPLVCGSIGSLQNGYSRTADLGDGFFRVLPSATASIAALVAVRAPRAANPSGAALNTRRAARAGAPRRAGERAARRPGRRERVPGQLHGAQCGRQRQARAPPACCAESAA